MKIVADGDGDSEELKELEKESFMSSQTTPSYDMQGSREEKPLQSVSPVSSSSQAASNGTWNPSQAAPHNEVQRSAEEKPFWIESPVSSTNESAMDDFLISFSPTFNSGPSDLAYER